jgi:hypothetical protein
MSSRYVRTLVEGWLQDAAMTVPYYRTINEEQNPQDDIWCTAEFSSPFRDLITYCEGLTTEEGEIEIEYFGLPGKGYDTLIQALEADMLILMAQRDPQGKCVLMRRSAPYETSRGSASAMYGLSVYVDYQLFE